MTVSSQQSYVEYIGDGVTKTFTITYYFILGSDISITLTDSSGTETNLIYGVDYSVVGDGSSTGGTATLNVAPASGVAVNIYRNPPVTQETVYYENGKFPAKSHEKALDKLTMIIQSLIYKVNIFNSKAVKVPEVGNWVSPKIADRKNKLFGWDDSGYPTAVLPPSGSASDVMIELAKPTGASLIGVQPQGNLSQVIQFVSPEQFGAKGDGTTNDTASIQAAIDWAFNNGGGVVRLGPKVYRAANLTLKPRVFLSGSGIVATVIKAPDNWTGNAVIMGEGYLTYTQDSTAAGGNVPACFNAGVTDLLVHANKDKFSGTPAKDFGCGILIAGENITIKSVKIIYAPSVGLVTINRGTKRELYAAVEPGKGWGIIGVLQNIRIQFCGNDCWHCEMADCYIDDVEIAEAGYGFASSDMVKSFYDPSELVSCFRVWENIEIGFMHVYGNWRGFGFVAGGNNVLKLHRVKIQHLVAESCQVGVYFKAKTYVQAAIVDIHECSGMNGNGIYDTATFPNKSPVAIFASEQPSTFSSVQLWQTTSNYNGTHILISGSRNTFGSIDCYRGFLSDNRGGTAIALTGTDNKILGGTVSGYAALNIDGLGSTGLHVIRGARNHVNLQITLGNVGVRFDGSADSVTSGRIAADSAITIPFLNAGNLSTYIKSGLELVSALGSNHQVVRGASGAVNTSSTSEQTVTITGLNLPYVPHSSEVNPHLIIDATNGSSIYPQLDYIMYTPAGSSTTELAFVVKLKNSNSPMQVTIGAKLN
ncbi:glycosyl hydrolase family 28-related protein [Cronobacter malonaticus]|uniref:glycosyl hydrolase family 28-related protein n=1 Tax=Cronobacter malonaticus TaxID=413503 RepID=UPI001375D90F|nr:glycosyl hydrolase family 28-related protein [Cronobacter malonaticus]NCH53288.1 hypothetical protein [Cronobacter malonaticus]